MITIEYVSFMSFRTRFYTYIYTHTHKTHKWTNIFERKYNSIDAGIMNVMLRTEEGRVL